MVFAKGLELLAGRVLGLGLTGALTAGLAAVLAAALATGLVVDATGVGVGLVGVLAIGLGAVWGVGLVGLVTDSVGVALTGFKTALPTGFALGLVAVLVGGAVTTLGAGFVLGLAAGLAEFATTLVFATALLLGLAGNLLLGFATDLTIGFADLEGAFIDGFVADLIGLLKGFATVPDFTMGFVLALVFASGFAEILAVVFFDGFAEVLAVLVFAAGLTAAFGVDLPDFALGFADTLVAGLAAGLTAFLRMALAAVFLPTGLTAGFLAITGLAFPF